MNITPGLELPNHQDPKPSAPIHYGNQQVPTPTNTAAKKVDPAKVMRQVMDAE